MKEQELKTVLNQLSNRQKAILTSNAWFQDKEKNPLEIYGIRKPMFGDSVKPGDFEKSSQKQEGEYRCVTYPAASALAAGWNREYTYLEGKNMGRGCKGHGIDVLFRPGMNIKRSPLCGRNFEYFSEDPVVAGELAAAFIAGVQSEGTSACPKHYACNNQEFERMSTNAVVSERALREVYLRGFQIAIEKGNPWSIMTSYNKVNGEYVPAGGRLMEILRKEFGFDGFVLSDAFAVRKGKTAASYYNGLDFELGGSHVGEVQDALDSGALPQYKINESIRHLIEVCEKIYQTEYDGKEDQEKEHALARKIAADCCVLLKNDGILPLDKKKKIAVIGALAKEPNYMGGGSGFSNAYRLENSYDEIAAALGYEPDYADAYLIVESPDEEPVLEENRISRAVDVAGSADVVLYFSGIPYGYECEGRDRENLKLPDCQVRALKRVMAVNPNTVLINTSGSAVDLSEFLDLPGMLHNYLAGEGLGGAIADVVFGMAEPGGRLPETFPVRLEDTPAYLSFPKYPTVMPDVLYGEDIFVGYRWYEARGIETMFPFGYGLSYTKFAYGEVRADRDCFTPKDVITVKLKVKNTGSRPGSQVLQLYVRPENPKVIRPVKELKAFEKIFLEAGEEKEAVIKVDRRAFEYFSDAQNRWIVESGRYCLLVGISSTEMIGEVMVSAVSNERAIMFHSQTTLERFAKDKHIKGALEFLTEAQKERFSLKSKESDNRIPWEPVMSSCQAYYVTEGEPMGWEDRLSEAELSDVIYRLNQETE